MARTLCLVLSCRAMSLEKVATRRPVRIHKTWSTTGRSTVAAPPLHAPTTPMPLAPAAAPPPPAAVAAAAPGWSRQHYATLGVLYVAYAVGMYAKGTVSLAIPFMKDTLTHDDVSKLLTFGSACYTLGKLLGGPATDYLGGRRTLVLMLAAMGGATLALGASSSFPAIAACYGLSRFAHSMTWPGVMNSIKPWFMGNGLSHALGEGSR
ncbi:hypothetical protein JL721_4004 [Aureococcus anophagefferens]|nr:hypothetical protein JL721_4004 [Aureococcus anophagefferens]